MRGSDVGSQSIFGGRAAPQPAEPGSYGRAPAGFRLPAGTAPGPVRLQVADLERSLDYYRSVLGLRLLDRAGAEARLGAGAGAGARPLVELRERPGARPAPRRGRLGLFHFAILLPDRSSLGRFVAHLDRTGVPAGAGDHLVSEAFYLQDPDDLGIEVYADRPRSVWRRVGEELMMATDPVDVEDLLHAAGEVAWRGMPEGTKMGHVHLHVGDLDAAAQFYSEGLGFDRTVWTYPGALFLAADGYHHHLGTNLWAGPGARPPEPDEAQLLEWTLELPDDESLVAAARSLADGGYAVEPAGTGGAAELVTRDPWDTSLRLRVASATAGARTAG